MRKFLLQRMIYQYRRCCMILYRKPDIVLYWLLTVWKRLKNIRNRILICMHDAEIENHIPFKINTSQRALFNSTRKRDDNQNRYSQRGDFAI